MRPLMLVHSPLSVTCLLYMRYTLNSLWCTYSKESTLSTRCHQLTIRNRHSPTIGPCIHYRWYTHYSVLTADCTWGILSAHSDVFTLTVVHSPLTFELVTIRGVIYTLQSWWCAYFQTGTLQSVWLAYYALQSVLRISSPWSTFSIQCDLLTLKEVCLHCNHCDVLMLRKQHSPSLWHVHSKRGTCNLQSLLCAYFKGATLSTLYMFTLREEHALSNHCDVLTLKDQHSPPSFACSP